MSLAAWVKKKSPRVKQETPYSCGVAALRAAMKRFGVDEDEASLRKSLQVNKETGTEPDRMVAVARSLGLSAKLHKGAVLSDLRSALARGRVPILLVQSPEGKADPRRTTEEGHYVVLEDIQGDEATIMDPETGKMQDEALANLLPRWRGLDEKGQLIHGLVVVVSK